MKPQVPSPKSKIQRKFGIFLGFGTWNLEFLTFLLYFTFFILHFSFVFSQSPKIDSLLSVLKTAKEDTGKVNTLNALSENLSRSGTYKLAMDHAYQAKQLAHKLGFANGIATAYTNIGNINKEQGNYPEALKSHLACLKTYEKIGNKKGIAASCNNIGNIYNNQGNYPEALKSHLACLKIMREIGHKKGIASSYNNIGNIYDNQGNYPEALKNYFASLEIDIEIGDKWSIAVDYNNIGLIYLRKGNYPKALKNYFDCLKIMEEIGDKKSVAISYNNIGNIYDNQGNYPEALKNYFASLKIKEEIGDKQGIAASYNNIGIILQKQGNYSEALKNYFASLKIDVEIGDKQSIAIDYNNIGNIYDNQGNYPEALKNYFASLKIREEIGDKKGIAMSYNSIGLICTTQKKYDDARKYLEKGLVLAKEIGIKDEIIVSYNGLSQLDSVQGKWKFAYEYHKLYSIYKDSIFNEESSKQMTEMQTKYETEKKEKEIALQKAEIVKKEAVIKQQNIQRIALASGFGLMLALAFVVFRAYRNKQKANKIISMQKAEVELQKSVIEEKNQNITDSIEYASYIQKAVLPTDEEYYRLFPESFILYKPRDIVSGDFYWVAAPLNPPIGGKQETNSSPNGGGQEGAALLCTADCTGHGVPGAFMSMLCTTLLNEAVNDKGLVTPNEIFEEVRNGIIAALKQHTGQTASSGQTGNTKDGMDATIISFIGTSLLAACANNPIYIVSNGSLTVIPHDRFPVGVYEGNQKPFTLHAIEAKKGDMIYTVTDGFEDQLGSPHHSPQREEERTSFYGKKFKSKRLKELLVLIASKPVKEQKEILEKIFEEWKGDGEQTDDVTIIGIRI